MAIEIVRCSINTCDFPQLHLFTKGYQPELELIVKKSEHFPHVCTFDFSGEFQNLEKANGFPALAFPYHPIRFLLVKILQK